MAKILPNRISKTLTEGNVTAAKDAIKVLVDILGTPVAISDDEYKGLAKLGDVLKPICDKVLEVAKDAPSYLEDEQPIEEVEKDKLYLEQLTDILKPFYDALFLYEREQGTTSAEYRNAIHNYESNVKAKVNRGSSAAQLILDKLNRIDRGTKPSPPKSPTPPPAAT